MATWIANFSYFGVFAVLMLSGMGLPIPEDLPLLLGGYLCATGAAQLWLMLPLTFITVVGADCVLYGLGRRWGQHVPRLPIISRFLDEKHLDRAQRSFHRHGGKTLFLVRFLPGVRAATYFTAGAFRIPFWKMLTADGLAALISVPVVVMVGWLFASHIDLIRQLSRDAQIALAAGLVLSVAAIYGFRRWRRARTEAANTTIAKLHAKTPDQAPSKSTSQVQRKVG